MGSGEYTFAGPKLLLHAVAGKHPLLAQDMQQVPIRRRRGSVTCLSAEILVREYQLGGNPHCNRQANQNRQQA